VTSLNDEARRRAAEAAAASRVEIKTLHHAADMAAVVALFDEVWANDGAPPVGSDHLVALAHGGSYVAGAFEGEVLLGASVAFLAVPAGEVLHSDVTGVRPVARDRRLGFAIKLHQRAWALEQGLSRVTWTFDPLIRRNAYFNLVKLGATVTSYLVDFYGDMTDGVNAGQGSDRLMASWLLADPAVAAACAGRPRTAPSGIGAPLLTVGSGSEPVLAGAEVVDDAFVRLAVPPDIEALRQTDPGVARRWRQTVRDTLGRELVSGARVAGFDPATGYLVERTTP
jgi:predicted GNAT superfamily acetyltransferase